MNAVIAILAFSGLILTAQATCDISACTPSVVDCAGIKTYSDCLAKEAGGCIGSQTTLKTALDAAANGLKATETTLGCGTGSNTGTASCNIGACTATASVDCTERNKYYDCLVKERDSCSGSQSTLKTALESAATVERTAKEALGCGGAGSITISVFTLLLPLVTVYIKM